MNCHVFHRFRRAVDLPAHQLLARRIQAVAVSDSTVTVTSHQMTTRHLGAPESWCSSLVPASELRFYEGAGGKSLVEAEGWTSEWWSLQGRVASLFRRADLRRRARDDARALLGAGGSEELLAVAEFAGPRSPGSMQSMLARGSCHPGRLDKLANRIDQALRQAGVTQSPCESTDRG